jgi:hypothetical protein
MVFLLPYSKAVNLEFAIASVVFIAIGVVFEASYGAALSVA